MNDDVVLSLYGDYILWCDSNGIPHKVWEEFYNTVRNYHPIDIAHLRAGYRDRSNSIQPNDEQRAVAEVMRMLGGAT